MNHNTDDVNLNPLSPEALFSSKKEKGIKVTLLFEVFPNKQSINYGKNQANMWVNIIRVGKGINVISLGCKNCYSLDGSRGVRDMG